MKRLHKQPAISAAALLLAFFLLCGMLSARSVSLELVSKTTPNGFFDVCADSNYAYCTTSCGVGIVKIRDPQYPAVFSSVFLADSAYQIKQKDNYIFVTNSNDGLKVIEVTNKYRPEVVGTCSTPGKVRAIYLKDSLVYLGEDGSGIQIINVADPENPYITGSYVSPNSSFFAHNISLKDSLIYAATESNCIEIINVGNPAAPVFAGNFCGASKPMSLAIIGDTMFVGDDSGDCLKIFDISDPLNPEFISSAPSNSSKPYDIAYYDDGFVFISDYNGISAFNVRNINNPIFEGSYNSAVGPSSLYIVKDYICYTTKSYGFFTVSIKPFLTMTGECFIAPFGGPGNIEIIDTLAYLNIPYCGSIIANVSDPSNPFWVDDGIPFECGSVSMYYHNGYMYCACGKLYIFDMNDPINPVPVKVIKEFPEPGEWLSHPLYEVIVHDNHAYARSDYIYVYDISDPANTLKIKTITGGSYTSCLDIFIDSSTDRLYACFDYGYDIRIYDISNPSQITHLGFYDHTTIWKNRINYICAQGDFAYFSTYDSLFILDISDLANPESLGYYDLPGEIAIGSIYFFDVIDDLAFIGGSNNLYIIDVSNPSNPALLIYHPLGIGSAATDIFVVDNYLYTAAWDSFRIFRLNVGPGDSTPLCGDTNDDGVTNLTDVTILINFLYSKEISPVSPAAADFDNSGIINLLDITYLIRYLFNDGPGPECNL